MSGKKKLIIAAVVLIAVGGVSAFFVKRTLDNNAKKVVYLEGAAAYQSGDYELAEEKLSDLKGYEDVDALLQDIHYQLAVQAFDRGDDESAEPVFASMKDYKDSQKYLYEITYHKMKAAMESGDYEAANTFADEIMGYSDVADVKQEILYHRALNRIDQTDFDGAKEIIAQISSEETAAYLLNVISYTQYSVACVQDLLGRYADIGAQSVTVLEAKYCVVSYNYGAEMPLVMLHIQVVDEQGATGEAYSAYNSHTYFASCLSLDIGTLDMQNQAEMAAYLKIQPNWDAEGTVTLSASALNILAVSQ